MLAWSWREGLGENFNFIRRLPVAAAVTLMAMITFVSAVNVKQLKSATFWRQRTFAVILSAKAFQENFVEMQRAFRAFVTTGEPGTEASYRADLALEDRQFRELVEMTSDNPAQQKRLGALAAAMDAIFAYERRTIELYHRGGTAAVARVEDTAMRRVLYNDVRNALLAFSQEEQAMLGLRDAEEQKGARSGANLFIFSSVMATVLLLAANFIVGREMGRRRRGEVEREKLIVELQKALEEVRTLSGMIPICGWCKSIRSDQGYWQSVEQYVRDHTGATFTHGICPDCAEKFKAEMAAAKP
jgi:CHASE3 domain sensor protein